MEKPAIPPDEAKRQAALDELGLLDTDPERRFDCLTRLATASLDVPIAYVSLVDCDRQWFKSACGIERGETSRAVSFCGHAILLDEPMIVQDTLLDPRFADNPLVTGEPGMRFYAGVPLRTLTGYKVGTFCIGDLVPRAFDSASEARLLDLAAAAENQLNLADALALQGRLAEAVRSAADTNNELVRRNELIRRVFGRYLSDEIAEAILDQPETLQPGGERRRVSILMSDLRGFTSMSERLEPEVVMTLLNRYFEVMIDVIGRYGGAVDEIIGDAILVIFGIPIPAEDDAERAVACALAMQQAMEAVNESNRRDGMPELAMGIGVNTGEVVVGNIGSKQRMKYGVVGAPVNMAARIESFTVGGQVLISEACRETVGECLRIDGQLRVKVRGVDSPVKIFDVGGIGGEHDLQLQRHG